MLQPAAPMSMSTPAGMLAAFGLTVEIVDIDGRLYGNLTDALRAPRRGSGSSRFRLDRCCPCLMVSAIDVGRRCPP
ncbi:hypothetical protein ACIQ6K_18960 [Streptomyces sp. NPDC096354]|uniref:hypothetical protein n=1 Tax=Streptomyces sp. NPDC096354 TaxID=3366088 RepID=UPI003821D1B5